MSREYLPETITVTVSLQHFDGGTYVSTVTVPGLTIAEAAQAFRGALAGVGFGEATINEILPRDTPAPG